MRKMGLDKYRLLIRIIKIYILVLVIWTILRYLFADFVRASDTNFFIFSIVAQPLVWLFPIFLYVKLVEKEKISTLGLVKKNLFCCIIVGITLSIFEYLLCNLLHAYLLSVFGYVDFSAMRFWTEPQSSNVHWLILMSFAAFAIWGFSEEVFHRGFVQTRLMNALTPLSAILMVAVLFSLSHIPIIIFVHRFTFNVSLCYFFNLFVWNIPISYFFYKSKNLFGCVVWHGLLDWQSFMYSVQYTWLGKGDPFQENFVHITATITSIVIAIIILLILYVLSIVLWKDTEERKQILVICPYCKSSFQITPTAKPFKIKCPSCNKKSVLR